MKQAATIAAAAEEELFSPGNQLVGQLVAFASAVVFFFLMRNTVPDPTMNWWLAIAVCGNLVPLGMHFARVGPRSPSGFWRRVNKATGWLNEVISIATILLLMPHANPNQLTFFVAYFIGKYPASLIADPANVSANRIGMTVVFSAFILVLLLDGREERLYLAGIMILFALFLLQSMGSIHAIIVENIAAKAASEAVSVELRQAVNEVAAERDAKTRFIAAASHDLAQPLQAARLFAQQARATSDPWQRDEAIRQTETTLKTTQAMLGQLVYHMRLEADEVAPQVQPVRIDRQLRDIAAWHAEAAASAGISIRVRCPALKLDSDPVLLDRAIGNLLQNAIVHSGASAITIVCAETAKGARIFVIDNGRGVPLEEAETIFADYIQGSGQRGGFGLGLASVVRVARLLGGAAGLQPRRRGAAFWISLSDGAARP